MKKGMKTMENNVDTFSKTLENSIKPQQKGNRAERRKINPKYGKRSKAPRNIASRKIKKG